MDPQATTVGIVLVLALVVLVVVARRRTRDRMRGLAGRAQGEVIDVWQDGTGPFILRYRFTPQGAAEAVTREEIAGCLQVNLPRVGEKVAVCYDLREPNRALVRWADR